MDRYFLHTGRYLGGYVRTCGSSRVFLRSDGDRTNAAVGWDFTAGNDGAARRLCLHGHGGGRELRVEAEQWRRRWGPALGGGKIGSASGRHHR